MNILVIGNGFDLAHGLPTKYSDFLNFLIACKSYPEDTCRDSLHEDVWAYIKAANEDHLNDLMQEILECLDDNVWYNYFCMQYQKKRLQRDHWIDFESEIKTIVEYFDRKIENVHYGFKKERGPEDYNIIQNKAFYFCQGLDFTKFNKQHGISSNNTNNDFIEKTYYDLQRIVRCLEIYLSDCVRQLPLAKCSTDIQKIKPNAILNFNYTDTYSKIYGQELAPEIHYIHGHAVPNRIIEENDMVLGVNEYWEDDSRDKNTNFNLYKKFVQRLIKGTGVDYKKWLESISDNYEMQFQRLSNNLKKTHIIKGNVYIFGHSLDATDQDVLREIMLTQGVRTIIFYRDKNQHAQQIANLFRILGQDKLLELAFSADPAIIFKRK